MLSVARFRWAACQLDALVDCLDYGELKRALTSFPETLYQTYDRILLGIPSKYKEKMTRILQFLVFSERPLRIKEAVDALVVDPTGVPYFDPKFRMPDPQEISRYCSSLVVNQGLELQLAHSTVKEYLMSNQLDKEFAESFQEVAARVSIATVCVAYLLHLDQEIPIQEVKDAFPLAQYSARYWMVNASVAEGEDEMVQDLIVDFFYSHERSYKICYSLYRPDKPWHDESDLRREDPASPLYYASFGGFRNAVQCLLSRGADVNAQGGKYGNALQAASYGGHEKVVELLLGEGADVNAQGGGEYGNALQAASVKGHEKVVELLLGAGADVNAREGYFGTALQAASSGGHEKVVELLLGAGADVNAR